MKKSKRKSQEQEKSEQNMKMSEETLKKEWNNEEDKKWNEN